MNCTGSWQLDSIYVKSGVVTWETQQTDYPRTRPLGMPNHEPRGRSRGMPPTAGISLLQRQPHQIPAGQEAAGQSLA